MSKFHLDVNGNPVPCSASVRACPRAHFGSEASARAYMENMMKDELFQVYQSEPVPVPVDDSFEKNVGNSPVYSGTENITLSMGSFRDDLLRFGAMMDEYQSYRRYVGGLEDSRYTPEFDSGAMDYMNKKQMWHDFRTANYPKIRREYALALKNYYMENVFEEDDVDCLFDDEQIFDFAGTTPGQF